MSTPVLHVLAGPNGAGKSTFHHHILRSTGLRFVDADVIAKQRWPGEEVARSYEAGRLAAEERSRLIAAGESFATETVFSHTSKLEVISEAQDRGYHVTLHIVMVPVDQAVLRVADRVSLGGHDVPEHKIRSRYERLVVLLGAGARRAEVAHVYDNSSSRRPFRKVVSWRNGACVWIEDVPGWMPGMLCASPA